MQNHRSISTGDEVAWVAPHSTFDGVHVPFLYQLTKQNQLLSLGAFECGLLCLQGCIIAAQFCLGKQNNTPGVGMTLLFFRESLYIIRILHNYRRQTKIV